MDEMRVCPACGASSTSASDAGTAFRCSFCGWTDAADAFPTLDPEAESRFNAETLPLPKEQAAALGLEQAAEPEAGTEPAGQVPEQSEPTAPQQAGESSAPAVPLPPAGESAAPADGPAHFRQLTDPTNSSEGSEEVLEQVPEELREVLAERMQTAKQQGLRPETVQSLRASGYHVEDDPGGVRLTGGTSKSPTLSPSDMVRIAAEQEGGVQPRAALPICPECQAVSPLGSARCQWCGAELPQQ